MRSARPSYSPDDPIDQFNLGVRYANGEDGRKAPTVAFHWYRKAAKQGYAPAQHNLAVCYAIGFGVTQDDALAARWYRKAAQQGYAAAQSNLGVCYAQGVGVPADASLAVFWSLKAGVQGEVTAQCNLGYFYHSGTGVTVSYSVAAAWYRKAAEQGSELAKTRFGKLSDSGIKPAMLNVKGEYMPPRKSTEVKQKTDLPKSNTYSLPRNSPRIAVSPCPICKVRIADHALKAHIREYHRPEPKLDPNTPKRPRIKKPAGPTLPVLSVSSNPVPAPAKASLESLCPRCGGDGGVRGGCSKCDGTGWVSLAMEHDVIYRPDKGIGENSRISNSDYLGGNGGAHFREIDGRIGTNPTHDDYSEES
ncbi:tetratricopeptide repeat protein [Pseudomonas fluorescens]|uniref:Sel1 repeat family protein n=1 Tax=Pseudomonas fluorescens TaxID=294 RepID=A0A5E6S4I3_PSEFL|nr:tetratricopeptide repeat protein [Pseudomonas fluorescens]VVM75280.1 hypothetical protein PS659_02055 [Pseudomonas fluorescens]